MRKDIHAKKKKINALQYGIINTIPCMVGSIKEKRKTLKKKVTLELSYLGVRLLC